MRNPTLILIATSLMVPCPGIARDKPTLPSYVLRAQTVAVLIDADAGIDLEHPDANKVAQKDVETALLNWGRFNPQMSSQNADLIIVIRKGSGRLVQDTIADPRQNNRPGVINPTDSGVSIGAQRGHPGNQQPGIADTSNSQNESPHTQAEVGRQEDIFTVYQGGVGDFLDTSPAWRYVAKKGLHAHDVPAVDAFRRAIADAEKKAGAHP